VIFLLISEKHFCIVFHNSVKSSLKERQRDGKIISNTAIAMSTTTFKLNNRWKWTSGFQEVIGRHQSNVTATLSPTRQTKRQAWDP